MTVAAGADVPVTVATGVPTGVVAGVVVAVTDGGIAGVTVGVSATGELQATAISATNKNVSDAALRRILFT